MTDNKLRVSLITPTYNERENIPILAEEIFSVIATEPDIDMELIVVDEIRLMARRGRRGTNRYLSTTGGAPRWQTRVGVGCNGGLCAFRARMHRRY